MRAVTGVVVAIAGFCVMVGVGLASQVTVGVALVGVACCLLILARIIQASAYHHEILRALAERPAANPWR